MDDRKPTQRRVRALLLLLALLVLSESAFAIYVYTFNHTKREYTAGEDCSAFTVTIAPRRGQTDSWPKILTKDGASVNYTGTIYDVTINNIGERDIWQWLLRIDITQDMYLNNAWCGTFEIHQHVDGREQVQTIDLRDYQPDELTIDYTVADPDLLVPLHPGDYLIYHPDFAADEYPVFGMDSEKKSQAVFGFITYTKADVVPAFDHFAMAYYLREAYLRNPIFICLFVAASLWLVAVIAFVSVEVNMKKAHERFVQDEHIIRQSIGVFTRFFEAKDIYTTGHSQRVATYSDMIAEKCGFNEDTRRKIHYIALMHDCGKCYIPDAILKKPGKLTDEEYEIIKSHTVKGAAMLEDFTSLEHVRDGVLYHHERYDGKGYPEGLAATKIPLVARIICVADSFDAMNSRRCYRNVLTKEYIISEIEKNKGKQFDPQLAELFLQLIREGKIDFADSQS